MPRRSVWFQGTSPSPQPAPVQILETLSLHGRVTNFKYTEQGVGVTFHSPTAARALTTSPIKVYAATPTPGAASVPRLNNSWLMGIGDTLGETVHSIDPPPPFEIPEDMPQPTITLTSEIEHDTLHSDALSLLTRYGSPSIRHGTPGTISMTLSWESTLALLNDSLVSHAPSSDDADTPSLTLKRCLRSGAVATIVVSPTPPGYNPGLNVQGLFLAAERKLNPVMIPPDQRPLKLSHLLAWTRFQREGFMPGLGPYPITHTQTCMLHPYLPPEQRDPSHWHANETLEGTITQVTDELAIRHKSHVYTSLRRIRDLYVRVLIPECDSARGDATYINTLRSIYEVAGGFQVMPIHPSKIRPSENHSERYTALHFGLTRLPSMGLHLNPVEVQTPHLKKYANIPSEHHPAQIPVPSLALSLTKEMSALQNKLAPLLSEITCVRGSPPIGAKFLMFGDHPPTGRTLPTPAALQTYVLMANALSAAAASSLLIIAPSSPAIAQTAPPGAEEAGTPANSPQAPPHDTDMEEVEEMLKIPPSPSFSREAESIRLAITALNQTEKEVSPTGVETLHTCLNPWISLAHKTISEGVLELYDASQTPLGGTLPSKEFRDQLRELSIGRKGTTNKFTLETAAPESGDGVRFLESIGTFSASRKILTLFGNK